MNDADVLRVTVTFLDHLESGKFILEVPHVMRRIRDILDEKISSVGCADQNASVPVVAPSGEDTPPPADDTTPAKENEVRADDHGDGWHDEWQENNDGGAVDWSNTDENIRLRFQEAVRVLKDTDAPLYVDVLFLLTRDGEYVIKEFSAECPGYPAAWTTVKSPPDATPNVPDNRYSTNAIHGLTWENGALDVRDLRSITGELFRNDRRVYMKGVSKITAVVKLLKVSRQNIVRLDSLQRLQDLRRYMHLEDGCPYHEHRARTLACAKKHTHAMVLHDCNSL